jgi:hypothetical protein
MLGQSVFPCFVMFIPLRCLLLFTKYYMCGCGATKGGEHGGGHSGKRLQRLSPIVDVENSNNGRDIAM